MPGGKISPVKRPYTILIADRNPNVRELLKREFLTLGYRIILAKNGNDVLNRIYGPEPLDLVILDLGLPDENGLCILQKVQNRIPTLPVIVHTFFADYNDFPTLNPLTSFVEKKGDSIEILKKMASKLLYKMELSRKKMMEDRNYD